MPIRVDLGHRCVNDVHTTSGCQTMSIDAMLIFAAALLPASPIVRNVESGTLIQET
jgi:hypothetical protein